MITIYIIIGSVREGRVGKTITDWFVQQLPKTANYNFEVIDLAQWHLPMTMEANLPALGQYHLTITKQWAAKISKADGYIFVTPEYNHGYPASLKNAIDHIYAEWQKKPVAFIGYGSLGAARAIEQLIQITAQIGMVPLPMLSLNVIDLGTALDENGAVKATHLKGSVDRLMTQLVEWAGNLKAIRQS